MLILPRKLLAIPVLLDVLVLAVAATLLAVVTLDLVDPTCTPTDVVNVQVDLGAARFVVAAMLPAMEEEMQSEVARRMARGRQEETQRDEDAEEGSGEVKRRHVPVRVEQRLALFLLVFLLVRL